MGTRTVDPAQGLRRLFRAEARRVADHHLGQPNDGIERRAQLVAHAGDKGRLGEAHRLGLVARGGERLFVTLALGDISVNDNASAFRQTTVPSSLARPRPW